MVLVPGGWVVCTISGLPCYLSAILGSNAFGGTDIYTLRTKVIGCAAGAFAGAAGGGTVAYLQTHETIALVLAVMTALIAVLMIGTTALVARRTRRARTSPKQQG